MRILLLGGAGYVGNALTQRLGNEDEIEVIHIYDNLARGKHLLTQQVVKSEKIHFTEADILDNYNLKKVLKNCDVIVHLATVKHTEHHYMEQVNHWGTANICNLVDTELLQKMVFLSTTEVYGNTTEKITSATEVNPQTPYAQSMLRAENYVKTLAKKCDVAIVRSADIYGYNPAMQLDAGLNKHFFEGKYNNLLQLDGDGLHLQSAIYINDLTKLLAHIVLEDCKQEYYLAATEQWSGMELYEKMQTLYPNLEATFTSHHLRLQDNVITSDAKTAEIIGKPTELVENLEEFNAKTNF